MDSILRSSGNFNSTSEEDSSSFSLMLARYLLLSGVPLPYA